MFDTDTFLTALYILVDDYCNMTGEPAKPGPAASLSASETITLAVFSQWQRFESQRAFYRYAEDNLRALFPKLPDRSQFNRQARIQCWSMCGFLVHMAALLKASSEPFEVLDTTAVPVRNIDRSGSGHLFGMAAIGYSGRLGFFEGFQVLVAVTASGVITGFGFGAGNAKEQHLSEAFLAARHHGLDRVPAVGEPPNSTLSIYLADRGFEGFTWQERWRTCYRAEVISPPKKSTRRHQWPKALRRQMNSWRQIVETVFARLHGDFALEDTRPHTLEGFWVAVAGKTALHNVCIWINRLLGRKNLAFADLIRW